MKYECPCGYVYDPAVGDPDNGIAPGTAWEDLPEDWVCPVCGLSKDAFTAVSYTHLRSMQNARTPVGVLAFAYPSFQKDAGRLPAA